MRFRRRGRCHFETIHRSLFYCHGVLLESLTSLSGLFLFYSSISDFSKLLAPFSHLFSLSLEHLDSISSSSAFCPYFHSSFSPLFLSFPPFFHVILFSLHCLLSCFLCSHSSLPPFFKKKYFLLISASLLSPPLTLLISDPFNTLFLQSSLFSFFYVLHFSSSLMPLFCVLSSLF